MARGEASISRLSSEIVSEETLRMQRQLFSPAGAYFMHDSAGKRVDKGVSAGWGCVVPKPEQYVCYHKFLLENE